MKQVVLVLDMEGASGIFPHSQRALWHGSEEWAAYGRACLTSDVLAVCAGALSAGVDEILIYDGHFAGKPEYNIMTERLPTNVRMIETQDRGFYWDRIRGQAAITPFGFITVGQHARNGAKNAYFPHTIQSPPIKSIHVNGIHVAEIGHAALAFEGVRYLANVGCAASHTEARELAPRVSCISVKDMEKGWEPTPKETFSTIRDGVFDAVSHAEEKDFLPVFSPCLFQMELCKGFHFDPPPQNKLAGPFCGQDCTVGVRHSRHRPQSLQFCEGNHCARLTLFNTEVSFYGQTFWHGRYSRRS